MADAIKERFGIDAEMIEGAGGIFDVKADGEVEYLHIDRVMELQADLVEVQHGLRQMICVKG